MRRSYAEKRYDRRDAVNKADKAEEVCDSMSVRMALIERMNSGELTLKEVQAELKKIKRDGKKAGKLTLHQVYMRS